MGLLWWLRWYRIYLQFRRPGFDPWVGKSPWRREWLPTPVFLPRDFHGQKSLAGYSPWSHEESDTTEPPALFSFLCLYEVDPTEWKVEPCWYFRSRKWLVAWLGHSLACSLEPWFWPGKGQTEPEYWCLMGIGSQEVLNTGLLSIHEREHGSELHGPLLEKSRRLCISREGKSNPRCMNNK